MKKTMEEFLDESCIRDEKSRAIAIALDNKRRQSRQQYSRLITLMSGAVAQKQQLKSLIFLAEARMPKEISELFDKEFESSAEAWANAVLLMKGLHGTAH